MGLFTLSSTTALEAINRLLASIGEAPVNTTNDNGLGEVAWAKSCIQEAAREVMDRGWGFNTDESVNLIPDSQGYIYVADDVLRIKPENDQTIRVSHRGDKLWDRDNNTFIFTDTTLKFRIVYIMNFQAIPDVARRYIMIKAARKFQQQYVSSQVLEKFEAQDEIEALAMLQDYDTDSQEVNMIYDNATGSNMLQRDGNESWIW